METGNGALFITVKDAAKLISVSPKFIWTAIRKGSGPPVKYLTDRVHSTTKKPTIRLNRQRFIEWFNNYPDTRGKS